jgi:hypothetical protein
MLFNQVDQDEMKQVFKKYQHLQLLFLATELEL